MPIICANIDLTLLDGLRRVMASASGADLRVGHFNLRGWGQLPDPVEGFPGTGEGPGFYAVRG